LRCGFDEIALVATVTYSANTGDAALRERPTRSGSKREHPISRCRNLRIDFLTRLECFVQHARHIARVIGVESPNQQQTVRGVQNLTGLAWQDHGHWSRTRSRPKNRCVQAIRDYQRRPSIYFADSL
jgi:hypothetical protein